MARPSYAGAKTETCPAAIFADGFAAEPPTPYADSHETTAGRQDFKITTMSIVRGLNLPSSHLPYALYTDWAP